MKSTLTPSFLAWRRRARLSALGAVATLSIGAMRSQRNDDDKDYARRADTIASNRAHDDHSIDDNDKVESKVSRFENDVAPVGMESSATLLQSERIRLAREVAEYRATQFAQRVASLPLMLTA